MSRRFRAAAVALPLALAVLAVVSGCFGRQPACEVRLGFVATFSGEGFRAGRDALEAARFAVEAANRSGRPSLHGKPCHVVLFVADDKASPELAARAVRELVDKKRVMAVIGPYPGDLANEAAQAAEAAGVPLVAPAATAAVVTAGRPHIFRIAFTDAFQGAVIGRLARRELGLTHVTVIANADSLPSQSLAKAFAQAFAACGGQTRIVPYAEGTRNFGPVARQALADAPQALFLPNASKESVLLALALRKAGFTGTLLGGDAWDGPEISRLAAFDGAYFVDHWREDCERPASKRYAAAFQKQRGHPPTELGALTQDAVDVVLAAVAKAGSVEPQAVTKALMHLPSHDGVTGSFDFVHDGNPVKSLFISRVEGGASRIVTREMAPPAPCSPEPAP